MTLLTLVYSLSVSAQAPVLHGRSAVLIDGITGQVLYDREGSSVQFPASTTKLLTALVAVEHGDINQIVRVSDKAVDQTPDSSSCYLNAGEEQRLEYLLYGLLLSSGNDCAVAIAEGVSGGNPQKFVQWMNETAWRLGATHGNFTNPHGLHDPNHFTTAIDLALIARAALSNEIILKISGTEEFKWPGKENGIYYNHNALLSTYKGTIGGKTGYTEEAQLTLVNAAKRQGRFLIGVVMGEGLKVDEYRDMTTLLDYGFEHFETKTAVAANAPLGNVPVLGGEKKVVAVIASHDLTITVPKGTEPKTTIARTFYPDVQAPIYVGQRLGTVEVLQDGHVLVAGPIVAQEAVLQKSPVFQRALIFIREGLKWLACVFGGAFLMRITVRLFRKILRRRYRKATHGRRFSEARRDASTSLHRIRNR